MNIVVDSVIRVNKKYYLQSLLKECKYKIKNNKIEVHLTMNLMTNLIMNLMINLLKINVVL